MHNQVGITEDWKTSADIGDRKGKSRVNYLLRCK